MNIFSIQMEIFRINFNVTEAKRKFKMLQKNALYYSIIVFLY